MSVHGVEEINRNLSRLESEMLRAAGDAADEIAQYLETYSKQNAPFKDRTGNLRGSIDGSWEQVGKDLFRVILSAGMDYAVFVELCRDGRYAFLWPAVNESLDEIKSIWARHLRL